MLAVPTTPVFTYYSDNVLQDDGGAPTIWPIVINEVVGIASLRFLVAARVGAVSIACINPLTGGNGRIVLVSFLSGVRREVDGIGLLKIVCGRSIDPVAF